MSGRERVSIFIDGSNFYHGTRDILKQGRKISFQKLINELLRDRELIDVFYYVAPLDFRTNPSKYWKHQKFLNNLRKISGFNVVLCTLRKIENEDGKFEFVVKGDDALLIRDLLVGAYENKYDIAIVVSGDEDFAPIIKTLQEIGKKVGNAYFVKSSSQALKQVCDFSIPLDRMISNVLE